MSVVLEVEKLIIPLGHDPYCVFHECANDEEASSRGYVSTASKSSGQQNVPFFNPGYMHSPTSPNNDSLFYRIRRGIQPFLDLVRLLPELFQWTWVIRCIGPARTPESIVLGTEVITRRAPYLSHGRCSMLIQRKVVDNKCISTVSGGALSTARSWRRKESNEYVGIKREWMC